MQYPTGDNCPAFDDIVRHLSCLGTSQQYPTGDNCPAFDDMVRHSPCLVTSQQYPTVPLCDDTMILCETLVMLGDIYSSIVLGQLSHFVMAL